MEEVASKVLIRWGQSVRSRAIPVPLGTLELRGCCPGRSLRQSDHRSSLAGKTRRLYFHRQLPACWVEEDQIRYRVLDFGSLWNASDADYRMRFIGTNHDVGV